MYLSEMLERAKSILDGHDLLTPADREMLDETILSLRDQEAETFRQQAAVIPTLKRGQEVRAMTYMLGEDDSYDVSDDNDEDEDGGRLCPLGAFLKLHGMPDGEDYWDWEK